VKASISAYRKLVGANGVKIIATTTSPVCLALKPLATADGVLLFANAAHPSITDRNTPLVLRHSNTVSQEGELIAQFLRSQEARDEGTFVVYLNNEFGEAFKQFFLSALPDEIRGFESYEPNQIDFKNLVDKVLASKPRRIVIVGFTKSMGILIKTFRERGFTGTLVTNFGFTSPGVVDLAGESAKGVYFVDYAYSFDSEPLKTLRDVAREKLGSELTPVGMLAYDVVRLIEQAVKETGTMKPEVLSSYIKSQGIFDIDGIRLQVTPIGDILPPLMVKRYE
jgi:ABC-type branched-subunit amino acid transport system substrate-binding protein